VIVGVKCGQCKAGFYNFDASNSDGCQPCNCDPSMSLSAVCDYDSGQCRCKDNVAGQRCEFCSSGWYLRGSTCFHCGCDPIGSVDVSSCNANTSQCVCKESVIGLNCDTCKDGYYGLVKHLT